MRKETPRWSENSSEELPTAPSQKMVLSDLADLVAMAPKRIGSPINTMFGGVSGTGPGKMNHPATK